MYAYIHTLKVGIDKEMYGFLATTVAICSL